MSSEVLTIYRRDRLDELRKMLRSMTVKEAMALTGLSRRQVYHLHSTFTKSLLSTIAMVGHLRTHCCVLIRVLLIGRQTRHAQVRIALKEVQTRRVTVIPLS